MNIHICKGMTEYFNYLRSKVAEVGREKLLPYENIRIICVGFTDGVDAYCVSANTIRRYYGGWRFDKDSNDQVVKEYRQDVEMILSGKDDEDIRNNNT